MLRIARLTERTGRYYVDDLASELSVDVVAVTHAREGTATRPCSAGRWIAGAATGLGLRGQVDPQAFAAVLSGRHPSSERPLRRPAQVSGFDLMFAAPKSVSALFGLCGPEVVASVLASHSAAVEAAVHYVSGHALAVRRGSGDDREVLPTTGVLGAAFAHGVSRALDPHVHTHVVVANTAHGTDGRWSAVDGRAVYAHAAAAGALYDAHLRRELTDRLGVRWTHRRNGAHELSDMDPAMLGALSNRSAVIRAHLADRGQGASARARAVAWASTRAPKPQTRTPIELRALWARRAAAVGVDVPSLRQSMDRGLAGDAPGAGDIRRRARADVIDEHRFHAGLSATSRTGIPRRAVVAAWAGAVAGGVRAADVDHCVDIVATWRPAVGVAEAAVRESDVVPGPHVLGALGPRPASAGALATWQQAARVVDRYRERWDPTGRHLPDVGGSSRLRASMPARQLAELLAVERQVAEARRRLGRDRGPGPRVPELTLER